MFSLLPKIQHLHEDPLDHVAENYFVRASDIYGMQLDGAWCWRYSSSHHRQLGCSFLLNPHGDK